MIIALMSEQICRDVEEQFMNEIISGLRGDTPSPWTSDGNEFDIDYVNPWRGQSVPHRPIKTFTGITTLIGDR